MRPIMTNLEMVFGERLAENLYSQVNGNPFTESFAKNGNIRGFINNIENLRYCNKPDEVSKVVVHTIIGMSQQIDKLTERLIEVESLRVNQPTGIEK